MIIDINMHWLPPELLHDPDLMEQYLHTVPRAYNEYAYLAKIPGTDIDQIMIEKPRGYVNLNMGRVVEGIQDHLPVPACVPAFYIVLPHRLLLVQSSSRNKKFITIDIILVDKIIDEHEVAVIPTNKKDIILNYISISFSSSSNVYPSIDTQRVIEEKLLE